MKVFWMAPLERRLEAAEAQVYANVASYCGSRGYEHLLHPYNRIDVVRNRVARAFMAATHDPEDVLVFLDQDHLHPANIVERLVSLNRPIAASLCFRRTQPFADSPPDALLWVMNHTAHQFELVRSWERGAVLDFDMAGWGAIAIRRKVFEAVETIMPWPWFRYVYRDGKDEFPSEDFFFGTAAFQKGIPFTVDTSLESPHISFATVDLATFDAWPWAEWDAQEGARLAARNAAGANGHAAEPLPR